MAGAWVVLPGGEQTMTVDELMTRKVRTIRMDATLREVRSIFRRRNFHHLMQL